jgi:glucose dehydrogenase
LSEVLEADLAVIGSGVCGLLVAREQLRAGREVLVLERGGEKAHSEQLKDGSHETGGATVSHNHEAAPGTRDYPWDYVYGVGGSTLHWAGVAPRMLPSDFELRSRHGVGRDWPISYEELSPFYEEAEHALGVAGAESSLFPRPRPYPQPAHPFSRVDQLVRPHLGPYLRLPQARPTKPIAGRPACCGSAQCRLCPVDARFSALHLLDDERMRSRRGFTLKSGTVAVRVKHQRGRATEIECLQASGQRIRVQAQNFVLAANGIENAAILLRSGLDRRGTGEYLFDHGHDLVELELSVDAGHGYGETLATGISYAYADGDRRSRSGSALVYPANTGLSVAPLVEAGLNAGRRGAKLRSEVRRRFKRTLVLDVIAEDLPQRERRVELSPRKDALGIPLNRIRFPADSPYLASARKHVAKDLERRLRSLGARLARVEPVAQGGHQLGTCHMGEHDGVVDPDLRHHDLANLYVAGGSAFPSYSAHHPTLTIAALGVRVGRLLASAR